LQESHVHATTLQESGFPATGPAPATAPATGAWGAWLQAPAEEAGLPAVLGELDALAGAGAALVGVHGGTGFTRTLVCEEVRMRHHLPALLADPDADRDTAVTAVLSGRADLIAATGGTT
jgi:salicyloyl-CoA 5-hydroxylase